MADNEHGSELFAFDEAFAPLAPERLSTEVDDIEALAWDSDGVWVVGSFSTNAEGEARPTRERILRPDGRAIGLDLSACPACEDARGVPTEQGGLDIEGAARLGDRLWLGLRSPLAPDGAAFLLAADLDGVVQEVIEVELDGSGVRELAPDGDGLLVLAGASARDEGDMAVWRLGSPNALPDRLAPAPQDAEGGALDPEDARALLYVTDGAGKPERCNEAARWGRVRLPR